MPDEFGKYDVYAVAGSSYCYADSNVLRNRFGITDSRQLRIIEADISSTRQSEMYKAPVNGRFSPSHLCRIHRQLLGDVYSFAGHYRREDIAKGKTRFVHYSEIPMKLTKLLAELKSENYLQNTTMKTFVSRSAFYMAEMNYIHPFREGNGRAVREFIRLLYLKRGYRIRWDAVSAEELLSAMIDSLYDTAHLEEVLMQCIESSLLDMQDST